MTNHAMMKVDFKRMEMKYIYTRLAFLFLLLCASCQKQEPEGPYIPWRPENVEKGTIELKDATRPLIVTEQSQGHIVIVDQPTGKIAWEWKPAEDGLDPSQVKLFTEPDEAKPVLDKSCVLVTASSGGAALVRIEDKKVLFVVNAGGSPHSAEILPDGSIVVACSNSNRLQIYKCQDGVYDTKPTSSAVVAAAHNAVWDKKRECLWTASEGRVYKYSYDKTQTTLTQEYGYDVPDDMSMIHDLIPVYGKDELYLTTGKNVFSFNPETGKVVSVELAYKKNVKSISTGPEGWPQILTRPTSSSYWTSEVVDFNGNCLFSYFKYKIYKVRWYVDQPFSY